MKRLIAIAVTIWMLVIVAHAVAITGSRAYELTLNRLKTQGGCYGILYNCLSVQAQAYQVGGPSSTIQWHGTGIVYRKLRLVGGGYSKCVGNYFWTPYGALYGPGSFSCIPAGPPA